MEASHTVAPEDPGSNLYWKLCSVSSSFPLIHCRVFELKQAPQVDAYLLKDGLAVLPVIKLTQDVLKTNISTFINGIIFRKGFGVPNALELGPFCVDWLIFLRKTVSTSFHLDINST